MLLFQHIWGSCQCKSGERTYISYIMHNLREIRLAVGKEHHIIVILHVQYIGHISYFKIKNFLLKYVT